jgi:uncharacterized damage-inducible protein DinB
MDLDYLDLYKRSSGWAAEKVAGAASSDLGGSTTCSDWTLRDLFNHMLETQRYFAAAGRGEQASPPGQTPPETLTDDPRADFEQVREEVIGVFSEEGVVEKTMPDGLAAAAYQTIHGRFSDEQRKGVFDPEVPVGDDASDQQRLLAYTGRRD